MTIGTGKMAADQTRAAKRSRSRHIGRRGASGSRDVPAVSGTSTCAVCAAPFARRELMFSGAGEVCPACFGDAEDTAFEAQVPGLRSRLLSALPMALAAWGWTGLVVYFVVGPNLDRLPHAHGYAAEGVLIFIVACAPLVGVALRTAERFQQLVRALRRSDGAEVVVEAAAEVAWLGVPVALVAATAAIPLVMWTLGGL